MNLPIIFTTRPSSTAFPPWNAELDDGDTFRLVFAVPGYTAGALAIEATDKSVTVRGQGHQRHAAITGFTMPSFERTIPFKVPVDVAGVSLQDGLLSITIRKAQEGPVRVPIQVH